MGSRHRTLLERNRKQRRKQQDRAKLLHGESKQWEGITTVYSQLSEVTVYRFSPFYSPWT